MSATPRAWILNLDAEHELSAKLRYAPTLHVRALVARESQQLLGQLVADHDVVITEELLAQGGAAAERAQGLVGLAWSPTPRALALLRAAGAEPIDAPPVEVLRRVNAREFAARLRQPLARGSFEKHVVDALPLAVEQIAQAAADGWLVRRTFGAAGRGRRRIASGAPSENELAWIEASLRIGPLVIEPFVHVTDEFTRSAWVDRDGLTVISPPCFQATDEHGAWTRTQRAERGAVSREDDARLEETVEIVGRALAKAGYFGPFGIDAYRHRAAGGAGSVLNPLSEINARFTMDWATAMVQRAESGEAVLRVEELARRSGLLSSA